MTIDRWNRSHSTRSDWWFHTQRRSLIQDTVQHLFNYTYIIIQHITLLILYDHHQHQSSSIILIMIIIITIILPIIITTIIKYRWSMHEDQLQSWDWTHASTASTDSSRLLACCFRNSSEMHSHLHFYSAVDELFADPL